MKKLILFLTAFVSCLVFLSGCKEEEAEIKKEKNESISSTEVNENKEDAENTSAEKKENSRGEKENNDKDNSTSEENEAIEKENDDDNSVAGGSYSNESGDITETAVKLHEKSCETQWKYLVDCPYQLDYEDASGEAFCVKGINSLSEITDEYCEVFAEIAPEFSEKYFEENGKVYCRDGGRGGNIYYKGTELILVSSDDNKASFTAVSHYADPETNEPMDSRSYDFEMIKDNEVWKTSVFTLPY